METVTLQQGHDKFDVMTNLELWVVMGGNSLNSSETRNQTTIPTESNEWNLPRNLLWRFCTLIISVIVIVLSEAWSSWVSRERWPIEIKQNLMEYFPLLPKKNELVKLKSGANQCVEPRTGTVEVLSAGTPCGPWWHQLSINSAKRYRHWKSVRHRGWPQ